MPANHCLQPTTRVSLVKDRRIERAAAEARRRPFKSSVIRAEHGILQTACRLGPGHFVGSRPLSFSCPFGPPTRGSVRLTEATVNTKVRAAQERIAAAATPAVTTGQR
jgi:hypothetical protein